MSNGNGNGWDDPKPQGDGRRLFLGKNDRNKPVRVRFVGVPQKLPDQQGDDGRTIRKYACRCIHKEVVDGKVVKSAKWFEFSPMIYYAIQDLFKNENWGNPEAYDVEVTRTEEAGKYYTVVPIPNCKPLSEEDMASAMDLPSHDELGNGGKGNGSGGGGSAQEFDPFVDE